MKTIDAMTDEEWLGHMKREETTCGIVRRKHRFAKAGQKIDYHRHYEFDHITCVFHGRARIEWDAFEGGRAFRGEFPAGHEVVVPKGANHKITALEDRTEVWCVFAARDFGGGA